MWQHAVLCHSRGRTVLRAHDAQILARCDEQVVEANHRKLCHCARTSLAPPPPHTHTPAPLPSDTEIAGNDGGPCRTPQAPRPNAAVAANRAYTADRHTRRTRTPCFGKERHRKPNQRSAESRSAPIDTIVCGSIPAQAIGAVQRSGTAQSVCALAVGSEVLDETERAERAEGLPGQRLCRCKHTTAHAPATTACYTTACCPRECRWLQSSLFAKEA